MVTFKSRASKIAASDDAAMPLPNDETTPPVIKINFVIYVFEVFRKEEFETFYATINKRRKLDKNRYLLASTRCVSSC